jgi:hypothetical protein
VGKARVIHAPGVDRAVIALWLGHESVETTQMYLDSDLALKIAKSSPRPNLSGGNQVAINPMTNCRPLVPA